MAPRGRHVCQRIAADNPRGAHPRWLGSREIAAGPPGSQLKIAGAAAVDRTLIVGVLDELGQSELVVRQADPADRRARLLQATAAGRERLRQVAADVATAERGLLAPLDPEAQQQLVGMLRLLVEATAGAGFDLTPCV